MLPTSVPSKRLAASLTASSSTIQLNNILGWNGSALTSSDFGTRLFAVLRNDANTLMEIMELDPSTIASASITILARGLKFTGDLSTEVTANKLAWVKNETIVEIGTDVPQLLNHMVQIIGNQTVAGVKTFSSLPATSAGDPVDDNDLARKAYVDGVVAGTFPANRLVVAGNAGETIADGDLVYFDSVTNNEWMKCDADTAASVENVLLGIAQGAGTDGVAITNGVLLLGLDDAQAGMTAGDVMYASNTAGDISSSPGTKEVTIGIAKSATELYFNPRLNQQITEDEQDALAGTSGTPSTNNKYVTADDVSNAVDQSQTTQDASQAVGEADATTKAAKVAQSFVAGKTNITGVILSKQADTGSFTGTVTVSLQADSSGSPSGSALATVTLSNAAWLLIPDDVEFAAIFGTAYSSFVPGTTYWIVIETSTNDNSNHPNLGTNSAGGYSSGSVKDNNTTDGWDDVATIDLYFKTLQTIASKAARADASGFSQLLPPYYADGGANDAYFIAVPGVTAYATGQSFTFKATTANTGAATLNVNSLGAKTIKKNHDQDLDTGDIEAGQMITVIYDGTNFQMLSQLGTGVVYGSGQTTRANAAGTGTQAIAHGLGVTPKLVRVRAYWIASDDQAIHSDGHARSTTTDEVTVWAFHTGANTGVNIEQVTDAIVALENAGGPSTDYGRATLSALDATNITLNWTTAVNAGATCYIIWEAWV